MASCYGRDGNADPEFVPCNHTAVFEQKHTSCCKSDENCFTNGMCRHAILGTDTNYYWLEGCTDPTFKDPACPPWASNRHVDNMYWKCPDSRAWCANNGGASPLKERQGHINTTCCNVTEFMFNAPDPVLYTQAEQMRLPISTSLSTSETALDESSITTSTSTSSATTTESMTLTSAITSSTTAVSSKQNTTSSSSGGSHNTSVGIGVGVGLGVGAIALSAIVYVLLRRKRRRFDELGGHEITEMPSPDVRHELNGHEVAAEMMTEKTRYEMRA